MNNSIDNSNVAIVDWIAFTERTNDEKQTLEDLKGILQKYFNIPREFWFVKDTGWNGYKHRINLGQYGLIAYGGESQQGTVHVSINGTGCSLVKSWQLIHDLAVTKPWTITRLDLAHDDYEGKTVNIDKCLQWYDEGLFTTSGRPPAVLLYDDRGTGTGKTLEIGKRKNGKFGRFYEKGKQLGDINSPWFRAEVQFNKKDRYIPWEAIIKRGQYLAGAYKALEFISAEQCRIKTIKKASEITYERMVEWLHTAGGKAINVMLMKEQGDGFAVLDQLIREGTPARLQPYEPHLDKVLQ